MNICLISTLCERTKIVRKLPSSTNSAAAAAARTTKNFRQHHRERGVQTAVETMPWQRLLRAFRYDVDAATRLSTPLTASNAACIYAHAVAKVCARLPMRHASCASHFHSRAHRARTLMHARRISMRAAFACAPDPHAFRLAHACPCALHALANAPGLRTCLRLTHDSYACARTCMRDAQSQANAPHTPTHARGSCMPAN
eukprot:3265889-Pleurochrysis_carterae.AAC.1